MHTRKSSPLPNPNDTMARYRINYEIHYQNLHRYLMTRIQKEKQSRNLLISQFNRLTKVYNRIQKESDSIEKVQQQIQQTKQKMQKVYVEICQKQLQIRKLFQQDEGIILQLCDILQSKQKDMKEKRLKQAQTHSISFLHYVKNVIKICDKNQTTQSLQANGASNSQSFQKQQQNSSNEGRNKLDQKLQQPPQDLCKNKQTPKKISSIVSQEKNLQTQQKPPQKQRENIQNSSLFDQKALNLTKRSLFKSDSTQKQKVQSVTSQQKNQQPFQKADQNLNETKNCIQLNSSTDENLTGTFQLKEQSLKNHRYQENSKKYKIRKKKVLKSCITILD